MTPEEYAALADQLYAAFDRKFTTAMAADLTKVVMREVASHKGIAATTMERIRKL